MLCLRYALEGEERTYTLTGDRIRLGRGSDNDVVLPDVSVSRYHAEIRRETNGWVIQDLKSTNGVELNRGPIERAPVHTGDRLGIGVFELAVEDLVALGRERPRDVRDVHDKAAEEEAAPLASLTNATIVRPLSDFAEAFGLTGKKTAPLPAEASDLDYANRMFGYLTRLGRILIDADAVDNVLIRVLDIAFEALPVDRGFILLSDDQGELVCELMRIKDRVELHPSVEVPVSRTMLRAVMRERVALVTFDAQSDQRLSGGESIRLHQIRAAICVPVWSGERIIGVMQVDSPFQVGAFVERDLDFLTTLANYAAVAVERIRYARQAAQEREMRGRLERYHSPAVIDEVLRRGGAPAGKPRLVQATVLFADLVGFTAFCERSGPEDVAELLGAFLNLSVEAIFRAGGTLDKFIGDCVMAFFGAPVPQQDHALRAARAAVEIQQGLTAWSAERQARGLPGFAARVGLNSGPVVVGDIGSDRRVDYTVLGNTVNVAARLESHVARPGDVVLGPETWRLLGGEIPTEPLGELQLKGLQQRIQAYRVAGV
ncbi:MAG TPA: adenylate/guanylate cyclase domain-containing protein [Thermoanaerobaculia bacterium]|nr:adenylate/guanylate cyclase domain-containing protein [Thermoanaerobaculia bacterium]